MFETVNRIYRNWGIGAFALPVLIVVALIGLKLTHSDRSAWVSEAVRAEFSGIDHGPDAAAMQPASGIRTGQMTDLKHTTSQR
jgi:hypothetical protein